jgi:hypothetical protein
VGIMGLDGVRGRNVVASCVLALPACSSWQEGVVEREGEI